MGSPGLIGERRFLKKELDMGQERLEENRNCKIT